MDWLVRIKLISALFVTASALVFSSAALAAMPHPEHRWQNLSQPKPERMVRVWCQILLKDRALIDADFPFLQGKSDLQVTQWLEWQLCWVSEGQINATYRDDPRYRVTTPFRLVTDRASAPAYLDMTVENGRLLRVAYRPRTYGRAIVFPVNWRSQLELILERYPALQGKSEAMMSEWLEKNGKLADFERIFDVKGSGAENPFPGDHRTGVATLGEVNREFSFEKLAARIMKKEEVTIKGHEVNTVGTYATFSYGNEILWDGGGRDLIGGEARQGQQRVQYKNRFSTVDNTFLDDASSQVIERALRKYGVVSNGQFFQSPHPFTTVNIQGTPENDIFDFGDMISVRKGTHFKKPVVPYDVMYGMAIENRGLPENYPVLFDPKNAEFPQPDPALHIDERWSSTEDGTSPDAKKDNVWNMYHRMANDLKNGRAAAEDFQKTHEWLMQGAPELVDPDCPQLLRTVMKKK